MTQDKDYRCLECKGTGADQDKTEKARKFGQCDEYSYIRCWNCLGNGLDPSKFFRWSSDAKPN